MKPYHNIPIIDCSEPLVKIPTSFTFFCPHAYQALGAPYADKSPFYLRTGVLQSLQIALQYLQEMDLGWQIKIFDAYRPIAVQKFMVEHTLAQLALEKGWQVEELSPSQHAELMETVGQFWAMPSLDLKNPPPHSTGAAIDLTLVDRNNLEIDMGSAIDEISQRSFPDHYQLSSDRQFQTFHKHRQILQEVMLKARFQQHPNEWWHFSLGDQMWAWLTNQQNNPDTPEIASYGRYE